MSIARSALIGGPAKLTYNGVFNGLHSQKDVEFSVEEKRNPVLTSMYGTIDQAISDALARVTLTPWGGWEDLAVILPAAFSSPTIGARIMGDADVPLVLLSNNGDQYTIHAAAVTKPPDLYLGADKPIFGPMEFTGVVKSGANMEDANSLYTIATGQSYANNWFAKTNYKQQIYTAVWGAITGFTSFQAEEGWNISHELSLEPVMVQGRTVDFKILDYLCMARCIPLGPTQAQIQSAAGIQGTGNPAGHRGTDNSLSADLVITGQSASPVVTLKNAAMVSHGFRFGGKPLRPGEVGFISNVSFAVGVPSARATFA